MKSISLMLLSLSFLLLNSSCNREGFCINGEGAIVTRNVELSDSLEGIILETSAKVFIRRGSSQSVEVQAQENVINELETVVRDGLWEIDTERCFTGRRDVHVFITTPSIHTVKINGSGDVQLDSLFETSYFELFINGSGDFVGAVQADEISTHIAGSGDADYRGSARFHEIKIAGSGDVYAFDLPVQDCNLRIDASGDADVEVQQNLEVLINGSGSVRYEGNPSLSVEINGSGQVNPF